MSSMKRQVQRQKSKQKDEGSRLSNLFWRVFPFALFIGFIIIFAFIDNHYWAENLVVLGVKGIFILLIVVCIVVYIYILRKIIKGKWGEIFSFNTESRVRKVLVFLFLTVAVALSVALCVFIIKSDF